MNQLSQALGVETPDDLRARVTSLQAALTEAQDWAKAALEAHNRIGAELTRLWATCKVVYWPLRQKTSPGYSYPIEHNPHAQKFQREAIEQAIAEDFAQP